MQHWPGVKKRPSPDRKAIPLKSNILLSPFRIERTSAVWKYDILNGEPLLDLNKLSKNTKLKCMVESKNHSCANTVWTVVKLFTSSATKFVRVYPIPYDYGTCQEGRKCIKNC